MLIDKALEHYFEKLIPLSLYYRFACAVLLLYGVPFLIVLFRICYHFMVHPLIGLYGRATPVMHWIFLLLAVVWLTGIVVRSIKKMKDFNILHGIYHNRMGVPRHYQSVLDEVRKEMGIRRRISLYQSYQTGTAFISGLIRPAIYLPVENFDDSELKAIVIHELQHYRQGDILIKFISVILSMVYWFWPPYFYISKKYNLYAEVNNDNYCVKMFGDSRKYYHILVDFSDLSCRDIDFFAPALLEEKDELVRRAKLVSTYKKTKTKLSWAALFVALVLVTCSITAYGATTAIQYGYNQVCNATMEGEQEEFVPVPELEEYEGSVTDLDGFTVIQEEEGAIRGRSGETFISTKLMNHCYYRSKAISKSKGGTIRVTVDVTPANKEVTVGISKPNGTTTYVKGKGTIAHTFNISEDGTYQLFISNYSGTQVTISGYYK